MSFKICPLKPHDDILQCRKDDCSWWYDEEDQCAVLYLAKGIAMLQHHLPAKLEKVNDSLEQLRQ